MGKKVKNREWSNGPVARKERKRKVLNTYSVLGSADLNNGTCLCHLERSV